MISNYANQLNLSFRLFLDHLLCSQNGFTNIVSGQLYPTIDPQYSTYQIAGSPFRQWGADSSISGMLIATGANNLSASIWNENSNYWNLESLIWNDPMTVDFERGRVIADSILTYPVYCTYAFKTWNIFNNFLSEPDLLIDRAFQIQSQVPQATGALNYFDEPINAIYVQNKYSENVPFAFGGTDTTQDDLSLVLLTTDSFTLDSTLSIMANTTQKYFNLIPINQSPFDILGGLKQYPYNYKTLCASQPNDSFVLIKKVRVSKFPQSLSKQLGKSIRGAFCDLELEYARNPRVYVR